VLVLKEKDLAKAKGQREAGVRAWWPEVPGRKTRPLCLAWADLALVNPDVRWPDGYHPETSEGWGRGDASLGMTWVEALGRVVEFPGVPVPDLSGPFEIPRGETALLTPTTWAPHELTGASLRVLTDKDGSPCRVSSKALRRAEAALGRLELRLTGFGAVIGYRSRSPRAVLVVVP